ncbi:hypothetical protein KP509_14G045200 [Ceratopteris richardii]|uniref:Uncharacterized protein n=1 Tax=Ceratopteris richardii TaxID=49495 RepID=A0A8T2TCB4_CERRI|nr:hypothetical protein KP509_14G045200 [Ceratopteris richardii]
MARAQLAALLLCVLFASLIVLSSCDSKHEASTESSKAEPAESNDGDGGYGYGHGGYGHGHGHGGYGHGGYGHGGYGHGHGGYGDGATAMGATAMAIKVINRGDRVAAAVNIRSYRPTYQYDVPAAIRSESLGSLVLVNFLE